MPRPNVILIVADDHAPAAIGAYGARYNRTPHVDLLAAQGLRLENCFCTNALCTPARASIMTGKYSHTTGIKTLNDVIDHDRETPLGMVFQAAGYQTAMVGKWHLGHGNNSDPGGFDYWNVLPGQGTYLDPETLEMGRVKANAGYVTDILTDSALEWLEEREAAQPFFLCLAHKAPHDSFEPHPRHLSSYTTAVPEPLTLRDNYQERAQAAAMSRAQIATMHLQHHLPRVSGTCAADVERVAWNYQEFIRNYYRCVQAIDENVGRLLHYLEAEGLVENTIVVYTADHGFFLGEHGWYDKRFMYEESIRIPYLMRYPAAIAPGTVREEMVLNVDFAPTLLELAGIPVPAEMQGRSFASLARGQAIPDWRQAMYYRYWMHLAHFHIPAHYGVRTDRYKLIYYYGRALGCTGAVDQDTRPEWELFDLHTDPQELHNRFDLAPYANVQADLLHTLNELQSALGDQPQH